MTESRESIELSWGERRKTAELRRSTRRVLRVEVRPSGEIVVFAPADAALDAVASRLKRKCGWIFRQLDAVESRKPLTPPRHFVSGETHLLLGKPYRLSIEEAQTPEVRTEGLQLRLYTPNPQDLANCQRLLLDFYAIMARQVFRERLAAMSPPFLRKGMEIPGLMIRPMSKRWGSYTGSGRVVLNVDLVRAAPALIDYVICHELAHAFHPDHGADWRNLLSTVMPDWESRKDQLEALLR
jgi:predicted metal-dependent hydrolase